MKKRLIRLSIFLVLVQGLISCSPYASLNVSAPFKVGPVYVNPSIGAGTFL